MHFALRGVEEQYSVVSKQFIHFPQDTKIYDADVYYEYAEFISKNNQHRFKDINSKNKVVRAYSEISSERCTVKLPDVYLEKLKSDSSFFHMRPLEKVSKQHDKLWYTSQQIGIYTLKSVIPKLSLEARCDVKYTNNSPLPISVTRMFAGGVPEKLIADKTGHHSLQSLSFHERPQPSMEKAIDKVIADPAESVFTETDLRDDHGTSTATKYTTPSLATNKQTPETTSSSESAYSTENVLLGTLNNCTINICYK